MLNSSIWPIDRTLSGATTPGQSGSSSDGSEEVLYFPQISKAGVIPSECFVSYPGDSLGERVLPLCKGAIGVFYRTPHHTHTHQPTWLNQQSACDLGLGKHIYSQSCLHKNKQTNKDSIVIWNIYIHTRTYTHAYIYIYMCVCVCVCVCACVF